MAKRATDFADEATERTLGHELNGLEKFSCQAEQRIPLCSFSSAACAAHFGTGPQRCQDSRQSNPDLVPFALHEEFADVESLTSHQLPPAKLRSHAKREHGLLSASDVTGEFNRCVKFA